jgi:hypothetical protein
MSWNSASANSLSERILTDLDTFGVATTAAALFWQRGGLDAL